VVGNRVNAERFAEIAGSKDTDRWAGVKVKLRVEQVKFQGKQVPAIRVVPLAEMRAAEHQAADSTGQSEKAPATSQDRPEGFVRPDGQTDRRERERPDDGNRPRPGVVFNGRR
jgi:hypothetical protein